MMAFATTDQLRPLAISEALAAGERRAFAFPDTPDPDAWEEWRAAFRGRLRARLGGLPVERGGLSFVAGPPIERPGYSRTYLEYTSAPGVTVPAWLLVPAGLAAPAPAVLALHGHGSGMDEPAGLGPDGAECDEPFGYHQSFALALCRRGMVVLVPELAGFGRRREPGELRGDPAASSCRAAAWWGIMLGRPLLGGRAWDALRGFDLLQSLPAVDSGRIGVMGGSGGGAVALLVAGLEPRLRAAVICSYFCTFTDSILAMEHCSCNYVPGLLQDAEMYDLAALIAPRPLLVEAGAADPIFPLPGVLAAYERLSAAYALLGAPGQLSRDVFPGGHQISGRMAYDFLQRQLGG